MSIPGSHLSPTLLPQRSSCDQRDLLPWPEGRWFSGKWACQVICNLGEKFPEQALGQSRYSVLTGWTSWLMECEGQAHMKCSPMKKRNDRGCFTKTRIYFLLFSRSVMSNSLWPYGLQHTRLPCPLPSPRACSNSCPLSRWCHPTISSSVIPFSSCPQSFPE